MPSIALLVAVSRNFERCLVDRHVWTAAAARLAAARSRVTALPGRPPASWLLGRLGPIGDASTAAVGIEDVAAASPSASRFATSRSSRGGCRDAMHDASILFIISPVLACQRPRTVIGRTSNSAKAVERDSRVYVHAMRPDSRQRTHGSVAWSRHRTPSRPAGWASRTALKPSCRGTRQTLLASQSAMQSCTTRVARWSIRVREDPADGLYFWEEAEKHQALLRYGNYRSQPRRNSLWEISRIERGADWQSLCLARAERLISYLLESRD